MLVLKIEKCSPLVREKVLIVFLMIIRYVLMVIMEWFNQNIIFLNIRSNEKLWIATGNIVYYL